MTTRALLFDAPGPPGPPGPKGAKGDIGPQGPAGPPISTTGTGFIHMTSSVLDGAARAVSLATADVTGLLPIANIAPGATATVLQMVGSVVSWAALPDADVTPGTPGQIFITNSSTVTAWTSLVSVELTHGRFTAGGTGSDYFATIGPLSGAETTNATLWLLPNGTALSTSNYAVNADGTNLSLNTRGASGLISLQAQNGTTVYATLNPTAMTMTTPLIQSASSVSAFTIGTNAVSAVLNLKTDANLAVVQFSHPTNAIEANWYDASGASQFTQTINAVSQTVNQSVIGNWTYNLYLNGSSTQMTLESNIWALGAAAWWVSFQQGQAYFGSFGSSTAPIFFTWTSTTTPLIQSGTAATSFTIGSNKSAAHLLLQGDAATTLLDLSTIVTMSATMSFAASMTVPTITQAQASSGSGTTFRIQAQAAATGSNAQGGNIQIMPGALDGSGGFGGALLCDSGGVTNLGVGQQGLQLSNTSVTISTTSTVLTAAQYKTPVIVLSGTVTNPSSVTFPNVAGVWLVDISGVTLSSTLAFKSGSATTATVSSLTSTSQVFIVSTRGGNTISLNV